MSLKPSRVILLALLAILLASGGAHAHQQKAAVTRVVFNERSGNIEVMHRFYLHDAEHAVRKLFGSGADILAAETTRRQFAAYVEDRFEMLADGRALPLRLIGFEIDGKFFWVYQETSIPDVIEKLSIGQQALRDIWPVQSNLVNVERAGQVSSLRFTNQAGLREVQVDAEG